MGKNHMRPSQSSRFDRAWGSNDGELCASCGQATMFEVWAGLLCPNCSSLVPLADVMLFEYLSAGDVFVSAKARVAGASIFRKIEFDPIIVEQFREWGKPLINALCLNRDNAPVVWAQDAPVVRIGHTL